MMFQIISRKADSSGVPYSLILVYSDTGAIVEAYEERTSRPNVYYELTRRNIPQLISFEVSPKEYNATKDCLSVQLKTDN